MYGDPHGKNNRQGIRCSGWLRWPCDKEVSEQSRKIQQANLADSKAQDNQVGGGEQLYTFTYFFLYFHVCILQFWMHVYVEAKIWCQESLEMAFPFSLLRGSLNQIYSSSIWLASQLVLRIPYFYFLRLEIKVICHGRPAFIHGFLGIHTNHCTRVASSLTSKLSPQIFYSHSENIFYYFWKSKVKLWMDGDLGSLTLVTVGT